MLVVPAYAKVNLCLDVVARRPDGWHEIASVIQTIDWHDLVALRCRGQGDTAITVRVSGPFAEGVPTDERNLAVRAAALLAEIAGRGFDISLSKQVPAAAGLGGGSADAAAVLRAGAVLTGTDPRRLPGLAAQLGSDVPAVLAGGALLATGRGEHLSPLANPTLHLALAVAGASVTAAAYAALTDGERRSSGRPQRLIDHLSHMTTELPDELLGSALEPAACRAAPGLADALARLRDTTPGTRWHLTGSGGAAFALARDARHAQTLAASAEHAGFPARACRTVAARLGPLP